MSKTTNIVNQATEVLDRAREQADSAPTWADLSNAIFDPVEGLIAKAYPAFEDRRKFQTTDCYRQLQQLVSEAMKRTGMIEGATPTKSGRFVVRLPRSLHHALEKEAEQENVSLNQLVVAKLACQLDRLASGRMGTIIQAYLEVRQGFSSDRVVADPNLNRKFLNRCRELGATGTDFDLNWTLYNARKSNHLANLPVKTKTYRIKNGDEFEFASEIAVAYIKRKRLAATGQEISLDRIICDPDLAAEFDRVAQKLAPGFPPLDYRWLALGIRKTGSHMQQAAKLDLPAFDPLGSTGAIRIQRLPEEPGLYLFQAKDRPAYVAQTENLRHRIERHFQYSGSHGLPDWLFGSRPPRLSLCIAVLPGVGASMRRAFELKAISLYTPDWNVSRVA